MTNTKRFTIAAVIGALALMLAMAATMFVPANIQKAHALGLSMKVTMKEPVANEWMDSSSFQKVDLSCSNIQGQYTVSGEWESETGSKLSRFRGGTNYHYTITVKCVEGYGPAIFDPGYEVLFNGPQLTNVKVNYVDDKTFTVTGDYLLPPSSIESIKVMNKDSKSATLYWLISDLEGCEGSALFMDGVLIGTYPKTYAPNVYQNVAIPYGATHKIYVCTYDKQGRYGAPSQTIDVALDPVPSVRPVVTKINANKVSIVWNKPSGATGTYIYANGKKIKTLSGKAKTYTYSAKGAAKKKYYMVTYVNSGGQTWTSPQSVTVKAEANKKTGISPGPSYYGYKLKNYLNMSGLSYTNAKSSTGRLKAKFTVTNTWKFVSTQTVKAKIKIKTASGKKVASQTFTVHGVKPWSKKVFTVYFNKAKTGMDLRTASMDYSIQVVR